MIDPTGLRSLACSDDAESRLIAQGEEGGWTLAVGPLDEQAIDEAEGNWSLLVNDVNRHVPEVSDLLQEFSFIPSWRVDDVMVSYAPSGGGIGPHVDSFDVFLLQGSGVRRWQIERCKLGAEEEASRLVEGVDIRVLHDFSPCHSWDLGPGDILYLPPRVPHYGVSMDDECMTYSIGLRAPSHQELVGFFSDAVASRRVLEDLRFVDASETVPEQPFMLDKATINRARAVIKGAMNEGLEDDAFFHSWLGSFLTSSKRLRDDSFPPAPDPEEHYSSTVLDGMGEALRSGAEGPPYLYRTEGLVCAYMAEEGGASTVFMDGSSFRLTSEIAWVAPLLCGAPRLSWVELVHGGEKDLCRSMKLLLEDLLEQGYLYAADD
ncbi:unnamed protein product [Chrysoparadoxa australica]